MRMKTVGSVGTFVLLSTAHALSCEAGKLRYSWLTQTCFSLPLQLLKATFAVRRKSNPCSCNKPNSCKTTKGFSSQACQLSADCHVLLSSLSIIQGWFPLFYPVRVQPRITDRQLRQHAGFPTVDPWRSHPHGISV